MDKETALELADIFGFIVLDLNNIESQMISVVDATIPHNKDREEIIGLIQILSKMGDALFEALLSAPSLDKTFKKELKDYTNYVRCQAKRQISTPANEFI